VKRIIIILICWAFTLGVFAQNTQPTTIYADTNKINTIFGNGSVKCKIPLGYFIELNAGYTQFGHKSVFLQGISMGLILDHHWTIGTTGNFIGNPGGLHFHHFDHDSTSDSIHGANLNGGYGGLLLEYILFPESRIHISFPLMIGGGCLYYSDQEHHSDSFYSFHGWSQDNISRGNLFFVIEPGVKVEFNVVKMLRVGLGISYRYAPDLDLKHAAPDLINQFTGKLSLRFGKF
jgi:hypothetical protein